jgi:hypothetical protein
MWPWLSPQFKTLLFIIKMTDYQAIRTFCIGSASGSTILIKWINLQATLIIAPLDYLLIILDLGISHSTFWYRFFWPTLIFKDLVNKDLKRNSELLVFSTMVSSTLSFSFYLHASQYIVITNQTSASLIILSSIKQSPPAPNRSMLSSL